VCVCVSLCTVVYTTQHRIVLIIFPLILQTIIIAQMMSAGGKGETHLICEEIILGDCGKSENPAQPRVACYMTIVEVDRLNRNRN